MKLMASGVMNWAAMTRSPSFSRSSSSTTTTILPAAMSSRASSMVANGISVRLMDNELLHVLGEDINLEIDGSPLPCTTQRRALQRLRDQRDREPVVADLRHGQRDAVDGDRPLLDDVAQQRRLGVDGHDPGEALLAHLAHDPEAVDVALHDVPAEAVGRAQRQLE